MRYLHIGFLAGIAAVQPALASSPEAWDAFRKEVHDACIAASAPLIENASADVDPFGSASYGLALVRGKAKDADTTVRAICVFNKRTKSVEVGGELPSSQ